MFLISSHKPSVTLLHAPVSVLWMVNTQRYFSTRASVSFHRTTIRISHNIMTTKRQTPTIQYISKLEIELWTPKALSNYDYHYLLYICHPIDKEPKATKQDPKPIRSQSDQVPMGCTRKTKDPQRTHPTTHSGQRNHCHRLEATHQRACTARLILIKFVVLVLLIIVSFSICLANKKLKLLILFQSCILTFIIM